jgi:RNA polymerase sigma factor (sigma-70 family)
MAKKSLDGCLQHLCKLAAVQTARELGDRELLERFVAAKDEAAFAVLVKRHGPMVLGVCRRVLGSAHDAEDACQAAFLVLAQKAASIRKTTSLPSWLHGVASRVAAHLRRERTRRGRRERETQGPEVADPAAEVSWRELQTVLDEELERLPDRLRAPLILCYLDGQPRDAAAQQLGLSIACLHGRLERGRKALCERLTRRGITLSAALMAAAIGEGVSRAALSPTAVVITTRAAVLIACGRTLQDGLVSTQILQLAREVAMNMFLTKLKLGASAFLGAALLAAALGGSLASVDAGQEAKAPPAAGSPRPAADKPLPSAAPAAPPSAGTRGDARPAEQERIGGRVLDPDGKPVAGAKVHLLQWGPAFGGPSPDQAPKVWAETDKDGRFSFTAPRYQGELFVTAAGFAPGWEMTGRFPSVEIVGAPQETKPAADNLVIRLAKDDVTVSGRLLDIQGEPVAGATVRVFALKASPDGKLDKWVAAVMKRAPGWSVPEHEYLSSNFIEGLAHFFPPITTDKAGGFRIKGVGRERIVEFTVEGPTIETKVIHVVTRPGLGDADIRIPEHIFFFGGGEIKELGRKPYYPPRFTHSADPCRVVTGVVRDKATGKPIGGAVVREEEPVRYPAYYNRTTTDKEGRYRLTGLPLTPEGPFAPRPNPSVVVLPPAGEPYPALRQTVPPDKEAKEAKFDFDLPAGVWLEGQVKDKATGRGVAAHLQYFPFTEWRLEGRAILPNGGGVQQFRDPSRQLTADKEGKFRILVAAERGMLGATATGEESDHYRAGVGADKLKGGEAKEQPGGGNVFVNPPRGPSVDSFDTLVEVKPEEGAPSVRCDVDLDPGRTLTVQVRGPGGKPLDGARVHGQSARFSYDGWSRDPRASEFTVYGLEPGRKRRLLLDHPKKNLAARYEVKGDEPGPVVITLKPAASAVGRLVDDDGRPLANAEILVRFRPSKDTPYQGYYHSRSFRTDAQGKFRIDGLIAGESYGGWVQRQVYIQSIFDDLSQKSGDVKDLGDIKVKKPGQ